MSEKRVGPLLPRAGSSMGHFPVVRWLPCKLSPQPWSPHPLHNQSSPGGSSKGPPMCSLLSNSLSTQTSPSPSISICNLLGGGQGPLHIRLIMPFSYASAHRCYHLILNLPFTRIGPQRSWDLKQRWEVLVTNQSVPCPPTPPSTQHSLAEQSAEQGVLGSLGQPRVPSWLGLTPAERR